MNYDNGLSYSNQWFDIIKQGNFPEEAQAKWIINESKNNFAEHFNRNWLEYRKSVTEAGDGASVEWSGKGASFTDVMGRKFIDWLGGFGMFDLGWCHPDVVEAVTAQVKRSPMKISLSEEAEWEEYFNKERKKVLDVLAEIETNI